MYLISTLLLFLWSSWVASIYHSSVYTGKFEGYASLACKTNETELECNVNISSMSTPKTCKLHYDDAEYDFCGTVYVVCNYIAHICVPNIMWHN